MTDYDNVAKDLMESASSIVSIAIIEGEDEIVHSTNNWDITGDLTTLNSFWESKNSGYITIFGARYSVLQCNSERLVSASYKITEDGKAFLKEAIIGLKDENRKILCKIKVDPKEAMDVLTIGFQEIARSLMSLGLKEPYLDPDFLLGKADPVEVEEVMPKFLFDSAKILRRLGLKRFGLSPEEARVYLTLLKKGENGEKVGNLNKELGIKRPTLYKILDRLKKKNWVEMETIAQRGTKIYIARPIVNLVNKIIKEKEEEIKILKSFRLLIDEYLGNGWEHASQFYKDSQSFGREVFDIEVLGIMGLEKDFGIMVFEYDDKDVIDEIRAKDKLYLVYEQIREQITKLKEENKIPDLENVEKDINFDKEVKFQDYSGAIIYLRFKKGSKSAKQLGEGWIVAIKEVAIPIDNVIYVIWGSEEKFQMLMDFILKNA